jgi:outer membrane receptor protein involved in Fe transport
MLHITPRWLLTIGGRLDRWSNYNGFSAKQAVWPDGSFTQTALAQRDESAFSPRISLLRKVNNNLSLVASGYRAFRAPTLNELYRGFRVGNVVTLANDQLKAERLTGGEAGAIVSGWNDRFMLRGNFFWSDISGPVANVTQSVTPDLITRQRENLGLTQSRGTEIEATALVTNQLALSGGYEFTDATVLRFPANVVLEGMQIPQVPRNSLNFQVRYLRPFIHLGVQGRFVGNAFDDDLNTLPLRRFFTMDVQVSHPFRPGLATFIAAENILNERYDVGRTPVLSVGPPILVRVGVKLEFARR